VRRPRTGQRRTTPENLGTLVDFGGPSIAAAMRRRSLPQLVIPVPCHVDWDTMTRLDSAGRARYCEKCARPVYDSASMTRGDLSDLIEWLEGRRLPCVRLHMRPDGTILTRDCFAPLTRFGRFLWLKVALAAVAFWAWALGIRPLARYVRESAEALRTVSRGDVVVGGQLSLPLDEHESEFMDPARLVPLPPSTPRPQAIPAPDWRPPLPAADRAEALHKVAADEDILNPPKRKPRYLWPERMRR